jgi:hypothetical protein
MLNLAASYAEPAEDNEATGKKGEGSRLRDRVRYEAVVHIGAKVSDDLSLVVDAVGYCLGCAGNVYFGEGPAAVEEAVLYACGIVKSPNDLPKSLMP